MNILINLKKLLGLILFISLDGLLIHSLLGIYTVSNGKLLFDSLGVIAGFSWFSLGVMLYFSFIFVRALLGYKSSFNNKHIAILSIMFFSFGVFINYANYYYVIKPNGMIECPPQIGYKKNLMRDYVTDLSLCEKF